MTNLAWKNLMHDRTRLSVTLTGIVFALVLMLVQGGLFLGFLDTSGNIVAHSGADLWIAGRGIPHVNAAPAIPERRRYQALGVEGVSRIDKFILQFNPWKLPNGSHEQIQVAGFDLEGRMGGPWNLTSGSIDALRSEDTVIVDELYKEKLGVTRIGETFELNGRRARVAGFTRGIRSFTTSPYVFASIANAMKYSRVGGLETTFLLVKAKPGADLKGLQERLRQAVPGVDIWTNGEMLAKTRYYWIVRTGAGVTTLIGAFLGLLVGMVVVAQTIYAATVDHLREFGTLKAMGATNGYLYRVILQQALWSGVIGYAAALAIGAYISHRSESGNAAILLPPGMAIGTFVLALAMCAGAALLSIRKAASIDPAMVFRG
jgi:putative ABC transport system permease protein